MDFVTGLPKLAQEYDAIWPWVIVDRLTKSAHFLPIRVNYSMDKLAQTYIQGMIKIHGVPETIDQIETHDFNQDSGSVYPKLWALGFI